MVKKETLIHRLQELNLPGDTIWVFEIPDNELGITAYIDVEAIVSTYRGVRQVPLNPQQQEAILAVVQEVYEAPMAVITKHKYGGSGIPGISTLIRLTEVVMTHVEREA